jgi:hypothetical protein
MTPTDQYYSDNFMVAIFDLSGNFQQLDCRSVDHDPIVETNVADPA